MTMDYQPKPKHRQGNDFDKEKRENLSKVDFSKKGSIDEPIVSMVSFINDSTDFYTTSSCSGRLIVASNTPSTTNRKKGCLWQFLSHEIVTEPSIVFDEISKFSTRNEGDQPPNTVNESTLKFEPFIMHVCCRSVQSGQAMHEIALASGLRNSGLTISKRGRVILAIRSTPSLQVPLVVDGQLMVSEEYIVKLVIKSNGLFKENEARISRFHDAIKNYLSR